MPSRPTVCSVRLVVPNAIGLHARPAALLVRVTQQFAAETVIECDQRRVSAKSVLGILTLCAAKGTELTVTAEGHDAEAAISAVQDLFACSFHEDEDGDAVAASRTPARQTARFTWQHDGGGGGTSLSAPSG